MTQILLFIAPSLLLCVLLSQRPGGLALAGRFLSRATPPGGGQRRRPKSRSRTAQAPGPHAPAQAGLSGYPDQSLDETPRAPVTPRFVVEHRTALGGKDVTVRGRVVLVAGLAGSALPRIFVAETREPGRDKNYDLMVLLSEDDDSYAAGDEVELRGTVESSKAAVYLRKSYGGTRP